MCTGRASRRRGTARVCARRSGRAHGPGPAHKTLCALHSVAYAGPRRRSSVPVIVQVPDPIRTRDRHPYHAPALGSRREQPLLAVSRLDGLRPLPPVTAGLPSPPRAGALPRRFSRCRAAAPHLKAQALPASAPPSPPRLCPQPCLRHCSFQTRLLSSQPSALSSPAPSQQPPAAAAVIVRRRRR